MSHTITPKQLAKQLKNVGPVFATKLINADIHSYDQLKKLGAKEAYIRILKSGGFCGKHHAGYLYALEGAIENCRWQDISAEKKEEFKKFTANLRKQ